MGTGGPSGIRSNNDWNYGGFLNYQLGVADQFFLTAAVRAQHSPKYGQDYKWDFTPKFGSSIILDFFDLTTKLSVSYGKATRVPPDQAILGQLRRNINTVPGEYYDIRPNNLIRPEKSVGTEGTLEVYAGSWGSLTINHYVQQIRDLINAPRVDSLYLQYPADPDRNTWVPVSQWRNVEAVKQVGWSGTGSLEAGSLSLRGTWSWSRSRTKYSPYDQLVNQEPVNLPSHYHSGSVSYAVGTTSVSLNAYYTGSSRRQYYYQENIQSSSRARLPMYRDIAQITWNNGYTYFGAPGYVKFDLNAMKRLRSWVDATIHVNNVGNSFASDRGSALPSLGRKTTLGFTIRHR